MEAIRTQRSDVEFIGVGGDTMVAAGLQPLADFSLLSINGFVDPLLRLVSLIRLMRLLIRELASTDVVIGVDFNVFNLLLERGLKKRKVPTVHYVSPSVYAWRRGRVKRIRKSTDVMLTLFPFELDVYREHQVQAVFVGHPTADRFDPERNKAEIKREARAANGWSEDETILCVMPGSRGSEIGFHFELFLDAVQEFQRSVNLSALRVVVPSKHPRLKSVWQELKGSFSHLNVEITDNEAVDVLAAADLALVKSGTGTLEALLLKTPMVVAYRMGELTFRIVRAMMFSEFVALPNILAGQQLVPERLQQDATPQTLGQELVKQYERDSDSLVAEFTNIHRQLKQNASLQAANTVLSLV